ncbi:hypothetical protein HAX54_014136 [Datura stramonium]|uniref:Uncharacterized protein n=1 Tax=Datura stramonium TaxID=4076 RepID=A0ABS8Y5T1_DATST|nr:hypothetical protein [Datura stramonium]
MPLLVPKVQKKVLPHGAILNPALARFDIWLTIENVILLAFKGCISGGFYLGLGEFLVQMTEQDQNKSSSIVKLKESQLSSKSLTSKGIPVQTGKGAKPLSSISKLKITPSVVLENTCKRKNPPISFKKDNGQMSTEVVCKHKTSIPLSVDDVVDDNEATRSMKGSTMPLLEIVEQVMILLLQKLVNESKVAIAHIKSSEAYVLPSYLSPLAASNFKPQEMISSFKMSYVSKTWGALCDWVARFSIDSSENFSKLKKDVNLILKEIKGIDAFETSALEGFVNVFFETYKEYDVMKSSSSQKMSRESYQKSLFNVQQHLIDAKEESTKVNRRMEDLQETLAKIKKS